MNTLLARMLGIGKTLWEFFLPILRTSLESTLSALLPIALDVVSSLASSGRSGAEKREAAVRQIQQIAVAQGLVAAESAVRLALELAVTKLKSKE